MKFEDAFYALILVTTMLCVLVLYLQVTKNDVRGHLQDCHEMVIREAHDHTRQIKDIMTRLNICLEVSRDE